MTLLNSAALFGFAALVVPIVIHLHRRRRATIVDWPAMQFLARTMASRRRGLTLEQLLLLFCRCLLVALFVLAMARPLVTSPSGLRWVLPLLFGGGGLFTLATAIVWRSGVWKRSLLVGVAVVLFAVAVGVVSLDDGSLIRSSDDRDLAIVIDGSMSMNISEDGKTHFQQSVDEAQTLINQLSGESTVSLCVAGPITRSLQDSPFRNLNRAADALAELESVGGGANLHDAVVRAQALVERGPNANKQVVVFTDNQLQSWQRLADHWSEANPTDEMSQEPPDDSPDEDLVGDSDSEESVQVYARLAKLPTEVDNLAVVGVRVSEPLVTTHRAIAIEIDVLNSGTASVSHRTLQLLIDDRVASSRPLPQLEPGTQTTVRFLHQFQSPGRHVVTGLMDVDDLVGEDNRFDSVVTVASQLPVLIVNGSPTTDPAERAATFASLALDPTSLSSTAGTSRDAADDFAARPTAISVQAVDAPDIAAIGSLDDYQVILACEVPRLPASTARRLAQFVAKGGGLWIIPDPAAEPDFYNRWTVAGSDDSLMPATLKKRAELTREAHRPQAGNLLGLDLSAISQPSLQQMVDGGEHDLSEVSFSSYWNVEPRESTSVALRLTNGDPLVIEHSVEQGRVLMQALSLGPQESNLVSRASFPVLMHLWAQHLASGDEFDVNYQPSRNLTVNLAASEAAQGEFESLRLVTPAGARRAVAVAPADRPRMVSVGLADAAGIYQLQQADPTIAPIRFAVVRDADESDLTTASEQKLQQLTASAGIQWIEELGQLNTLGSHNTAGREIWQVLICAALLVVVAESVLTRWIIRRRAVDSDELNGASAMVTPASQSYAEPFVDSPRGHRQFSLRSLRVLAGRESE